MRRQWIALAIVLAWITSAGIARGADATPKAAGTAPGGAPASKASGRTAVNLYVPPAPNSRLEGGRVGGGTRSARQSPCDTRVSVVAPEEHAGLTLEAQPTLYFLLSKDTDCRLVFVLNDRRQVPPLIESPLAGSGRAGVHAIRLVDLGISLEPEVEYDWFVRVAGAAPAGPGDPYSGGQIRRVPAPDGIAAELAGTGARKASILGGHSLWYDTVAELSKEIEGDPENDSLRTQRAVLFEAEGLADPGSLDGSGRRPID